MSALRTIAIRMAFVLLTASAAVAFAACGKKGPLYLPSPTAVAPAGETPAPRGDQDRR